MKKVILAVIMAASKEGILCELTVSTKGCHMTTKGSLKLDTPTNADQAVVSVWRGGESSSLTLDTEGSDLSVNTTEGKYEIAVGGVCITFQEAFKTDPFTVTPNA